MPRYTASDIVHTASTDHRIVRLAGPRPIHPSDLDPALLVDFYRDRFPEGDPEAERSLGIGLVRLMVGGPLEPRRHGEQVMRLLESALGQHPADDDLRESKALALAVLGRHGEALAEAQAVLARRPGNWRLLAQAAGAAQAEGQTERALAWWRQAIDSNPFVPDYHVSLIALLLRSGEMKEARARCEKLLLLDPLNVSGRQAWIGFLLQDGKKAQARREFDIIRRLKPPDLPQREQWFKQQMR
jgi:tetratricopeptide (TPR) repeat protein